MEIENKEFTGGSLKISTGVLSRIARLAAQEVEGVKQVSGMIPQGKNILGKSNLAHGVAVELQDDVAEISVSIEVVYGNKVPTICAKVQESVKAAVQNMAGVTVSRVNVVVAGVTGVVEE